MGLPHHQQGAPSVWLWRSRARVLSCAQPRPCGALVSLRYCMRGWAPGVWWVCEGLNLMDQRVLAFVKVGLWLADCSPVESHPLCSLSLTVLNVLCVALSLLCVGGSRRLVVLAVARGVEGSSRCVVKSLSSACPRRSACRARRRCCSRASWPLLVRRCAHAAVLMSPALTVACSIECSSRRFVSADSSRAVRVPVRAGGALPCPSAGGGWGVGVGAVVTRGLGARWPLGRCPPPRAA